MCCYTGYTCAPNFFRWNGVFYICYNFYLHIKNCTIHLEWSPTPDITLGCNVPLLHGQIRKTLNTYQKKNTQVFWDVTLLSPSE